MHQVTDHTSLDIGIGSNDVRLQIMPANGV